MATVQIAILAAGMGTRLKRPMPKPLTPLDDGRTILQQQVDNVRTVFGDDARVILVVGFKHELLMEAQPDLLFAYNEDYDQTNTSKSLLKALRGSSDGPVIWMNGDVVFDPEVLRRLRPLLDDGRSAIAVNTAATADEEVKYTVGADGFVDALSKQVTDALGEAVGINLVAAADKATLIRRLEQCDDQDYFERAIELAVEHDGLRVTPVDISDLFAVEVDNASDLARAIEQRQAYERRQ
ncbi:MAG: NTP transferase domain-containing protein [Jatrophihabitans sp.]|uniref:phosphocholine cytidylyltransferase family protein n=1 Tax=Jatrophihabitans sp. TaxID=1932789 RepID=UPI003F7FC1CA